jgi:predicted DNA-binding transcriptional regulator YafY
MASLVSGFGPAVKVMAPDDLKVAVIRRLQNTLDAVIPGVGEAP